MRQGNNQQYQNIVFVSSPEGHREQYVNLLAQRLALAPLCAPIDLKIIWRLIRCKRLLLATIDDHILIYSFILVCRSLYGRNSVALFLSPQRCFSTVRLKYRLRRWYFQALKSVPRATILTILPFSIDSRYALVASAGVADPQLWDQLPDKDAQESAVSGELHAASWIKNIKQNAAGRRIVTLPGTLSALKGFDYFAELFAQIPSLKEEYLFVAAGKVSPSMQNSAHAFTEAGGILVNKVLSDTEMQHLYIFSDFIWACYSPDYDQASGIFGRALQYKVPVFVRQESLVHRLASCLNAPAVPIAFGDIHACARQIQAAASIEQPQSDAHIEVLKSWKASFLSTVHTALENGEGT